MKGRKREREGESDRRTDLRTYCRVLQVHLYRESNIDAPLHTISLGPTTFFHLPALTIDNQVTINLCFLLMMEISGEIYVDFLGGLNSSHFERPPTSLNP